jgi:hypothetical protein
VTDTAEAAEEYASLLAALKQAARHALHCVSDEKIAEFRVTDDDGTEHVAGRDDLLLLVSEARSVPNLLEFVRLLGVDVHFHDVGEGCAS